MSAEIINLNNVTKLDIPTAKVLGRAAAEHEFNSVVVIGFESNGSFFFASSKADGGDVLWLLELAKKKLLEAGDPDQ